MNDVAKKISLLENSGENTDFFPKCSQDFSQCTGWAFPIGYCYYEKNNFYLHNYLLSYQYVMKMASRNP